MSALRLESDELAYSNESVLPSAFLRTNPPRVGKSVYGEQDLRMPFSRSGIKL